MKYNPRNNSVNDLKIAYIGGGSRGWAWTFMTDLAMEGNLSGEIRLYDIDSDAAEKNKKIGNLVSSRPDSKGKWKYNVYDSLQSVLENADFVVISILPGTFDEMESDVHLPERLGIYQSVGDTVGPGGIIRALRTIPMIAKIGEAIKEYAPLAWVINYTNPLSLCIKTLYHVFPEIKAFGCCHEVFAVQEMLCEIVKSSINIPNIKREDIHTDVIGINHFSWFSKASYKGIDLFPIYKDFVNGNFDNGFEKESDNWMNSTFSSANRVKFDLFQKFGLIAAAGDRHLAEFMPGNEYLNSPDTVKAWKFQLTPVSWRKSDLIEKLNRSERLYNEEEEIELKSTGEEGILLIKAICGLDRIISNVNIPNTNRQIPNLPEDATVETNAIFDRDSIKPIITSPIPESILNLTMPHIRNHTKILDASLNPNLQEVVDAFMEDPLIVGKKISRKDAEKLAIDMIRNTLNYLPEKWKEIIK